MDTNATTTMPVTAGMLGAKPARSGCRYDSCVSPQPPSAAPRSVPPRKEAQRCTKAELIAILRKADDWDGVVETAADKAASGERIRADRERSGHRPIATSGWPSSGWRGAPS